MAETIAMLAAGGVIVSVSIGVAYLVIHLYQE